MFILIRSAYDKDDDDNYVKYVVQRDLSVIETEIESSSEEEEEENGNNNNDDDEKCEEGVKWKIYGWIFYGSNY